MRLQQKMGFTLIEVIITLAIAAILIAAITPNVTAYIQKSNQIKENTAAESVFDALQTFAANKSISLFHGDATIARLVPSDDAEVYAYIKNLTDAVKVIIKREDITRPLTDNHVEVQIKGVGENAIITVYYGKYGVYRALFN